MRNRRTRASPLPVYPVPFESDQNGVTSSLCANHTIADYFCQEDQKKLGSSMCFQLHKIKDFQYYLWIFRILTQLRLTTLQPNSRKTLPLLQTSHLLEKWSGRLKIHDGLLSLRTTSRLAPPRSGPYRNLRLQ